MFPDSERTHNNHNNPSSITQKMTKAYENLSKNNGVSEHSYLRGIKSHSIRRKDVMIEQTKRINSALSKDLEVECTFQPEINRESKAIIKKHENEA